MYKTDSGFYIIDVLPLHHASKRPFHLEKRMQSKKSGSYEAQAKREAILEERRMKLARQYLHVKDVLSKQHQHALHDSSTKRSQIQKTLQSAERKRNTILQQLVEQCAQQVARCKEVARQQQLKNQEEIDRRRADMERRQKATAARRAKLLAVPKSRILNSNIQLTREQAATIIQNNWRYRQYYSVAKTFRKFNISLKSTKILSFQETVKLLKQPAIIQVTLRLLQRMRKASPLTSGSNRYKNLARVFLSAYMIVSHTDEILESIGKHEKALLESAKNMLDEFEHWIDEIVYGPPNKIHYNILCKFLSLWTVYYNDFNSWKSKDSEELANNLIAHYVDMEKLWNSVKGQANAETEWRPSLKQQQEKIRQKIRHLSGESGMARLESALAQLRENLPNEDINDFYKLDTVKGSSVIEENDRDLCTKRESSGSRESSLAPKDKTTFKTNSPQTPSLQKNAQNNLVNNIEHNPLSSVSISSDKGKSTVNATLSEPFGAIDLSSVAVSGHDLRRIIGPVGDVGITNEQLAHEIIIDPDFEIKPRSVQLMATDAFFNCVKAEFEQGKYDNFLPQLLEEIKQNLLELVPPSSALFTSINEVLDIELIKQQTKAGVYNFRNCIMFITKTMLQICAPVRDEQIKALKEITELSEILRRLLEILGLMRLDLNNYRVKALRPFIKEQAVEYERRKFEQSLENNKISLELTKTWLKPTIESLLRTAAERNPENVHLPQHQHNYGVKFDQAYNEALVSYIFQATGIDKSNCPETFALDVARLFNFQNEGQAITIVAALLMLTKNVVLGSGTIQSKPSNSTNFSSSVHIEDNMNKLKDRLFVLLTDDETTLENLSAEIISQLPSTLTAENQALIKSMVSKTLSQSDKVFSLLSRRIQSIIKLHLQTGQFPKRETLAQYGVLPVAKELEQLSNKICVVGRYNREVYAKWYDAVIWELLREVRGDS
ncbi:14635_t:CDS:2 [Ambispora leptoticha]|uniref:14635_t:CDS:1 n=1 Tax=Ambispora leptoticha TaxID=144679 RepID=A0A9N8VGE0_9GLOM|nr:14635_t:CDS:2 [Ambispora leptoticha]